MQEWGNPFSFGSLLFELNGLSLENDLQKITVKKNPHLHELIMLMQKSQMLLNKEKEVNLNEKQ